MTDFASLTVAAERQDADQIAVARGSDTLRMALSVLLAGLEGGGLVDVTEDGLPTADADAKGKLYVNHEIPAGWIVHESPQTETDPAGAFAEYGSDQAVAYTAATRARAYLRDLDLGIGGNRRGVADTATIWIIDGTTARAYHAGSLARHHDLDIDLGAGTWTGGLTDGSRVWFIDNATDFARGYTVSTGTRAAGFDINLGTGGWSGGVSDGTTLWFIDDNTNFARAYVASTRQRSAAADINLGTGDWRGGATDGTTLWFLDDDNGELAAYVRATRVRDTGNDITLPGTNTGCFSDGTTLWVIRDVSAHNFVGEFGTDAAATAGGWTSNGEWYYNTGDRTGYRIDRVSGSLRSRAHSMTTLLGANHIWLGHADSEADLLLRIADFNTNTTYVGEVGNRLLQLYNDSYTAGNDGHTIWDWSLVFGVGTPAGFVTHEVGRRSTAANIDTDWFGTGIILPDPMEAEWVVIHVNNGEWHLNRTADYANVNTSSAGNAPVTDSIWDRVIELATAGVTTQVRFYNFGITDDRELLIAANTANVPVSSLEVRSVPFPIG